jgi:hypothetical protein
LKFVINTSCLSCEVQFQVVTRRSVIAKARFQSLTIPYEILGGQGNAETGVFS